jgi:hypothetical protein
MFECFVAIALFRGNVEFCRRECGGAQHDSVHRYVWLGDIWQDGDELLREFVVRVSCERIVFVQSPENGCL